MNVKIHQILTINAVKKWFSKLIQLNVNIFRLMPYYSGYSVMADIVNA